MQCAHFVRTNRREGGRRPRLCPRVDAGIACPAGQVLAAREHLDDMLNIFASTNATRRSNFLEPRGDWADDWCGTCRDFDIVRVDPLRRGRKRPHRCTSAARTQKVEYV